MKTTSSPLVLVTRGPITESVHSGHIAVVSTDGKVKAYVGDPYMVTYARSAAKPLQAIPVIASGAAESYGLTEAEIALLCASHNGETNHIQTVRSILAKIGLDEADLQCGAHPPLHKPASIALREAGVKPAAIHNTCSGKHSGMLALAVYRGESPAGYLSPNHPVQQEMLGTILSFTDMPASDIAIGTDGCGVPVFGLPLSSLAKAYARLGTPEDPALPDGTSQACRTILNAITRHPDMLAGTDRYDTALIRATNGRIIGKMGAEGVFAAALVGEGLALALKIDDGSERPLYSAVTEALLQLGWIDEQAAAELGNHHKPVLRNWSGTVVGGLIPDFRLQGN